MTWSIKTRQFFQFFNVGGTTVQGSRGGALQSLPAVALEGTPPGRSLLLSKLDRRSGHGAELARQPLRRLDEIPSTGSDLLVQTA